MILLPVCLSGCFGGGMMPSLDSADRSLTTNSVAPKSSAPTEKESDEITVRNAVSSVDLTKMGAASIPWANANTGSAGVISAITEEADGGFACRTFTTTRHSYRGISNFSGKACLVDEGEWRLVNFKEAD
ncbi:hypothetical protein M2360_001980 [Rhizobium sp. SG_E_25_P2]|jgi:17 kDa outer membrane surface antigen|uniref:RT0821/Lpp0805 family surface protein n=1 Tax=Rhizobium sp. SG_E_25_P2 TaxID=2879942 RepID=UPI002473E63F|nr:RT0821/Lpp0805 family surface protein [Rhizobium sp. SG_E_25_P2]MDH6266584.1 hypothetical protein [Rhizobium sp. SG_E_25_P2]